MLGAGYAFGQGPPEQKDLRISAGVMGFGNTELLYTDEGGGNFKAFPLMLLEYKSFYWKATEIGYEWNVKPWIQVVPFAQFLGGLGLTGIYRFA